MEKYDKGIVHRIEHRLNVSFRKLSDKTQYLLYRSEQRIIRNEEREKQIVYADNNKGPALSDLQKELLVENEKRISAAEERDNLIVNMAAKRKLTGPEEFQLQDTSERIEKDEKRYWQIVETPQDNETLMERVYEKLGKMRQETIADKDRPFFADYENALSYRENLRDEAIKTLEYDWLQPKPFSVELGWSRTNLYSSKVRKDYHELTRLLFAKTLPYAKLSEQENEISELNLRISKMESRDADYAELLSETNWLRTQLDEKTKEAKDKTDLNRQRNLEKEDLERKLANANQKLDWIRQNYPNIVI